MFKIAQLGLLKMTRKVNNGETFIICHSFLTWEYKVMFNVWSFNKYVVCDTHLKIIKNIQQNETTTNT